MAKRFTNPDWQFMNYGDVTPDGEAPLVLEPKDEHHRYPLQLYHYMAVKVDMKGKDVLEVGCGRGGGANFIYRYHKPATYTGMDLAENAIAFCTKNYTGDGLKFISGNAEELPFQDASFDVVMNIESCNAYGSVPKFLSEVKRVLRPGGTLLIADMRWQHDLQQFKDELAASGMNIIYEDNFTERVQKALDAEHEINEKRIESNVPKALQNMFKEFAATKGTVVYNAIKNKERLYYRFVLVKP